MAYKNNTKGTYITLAILSSLLFSQVVFAGEVQSPVQEVKVANSYLTKAHIKTNSKTQIQTIKIEKSFLVWVTVQKGKDNPPAIDTAK